MREQNKEASFLVGALPTAEFPPFTAAYLSQRQSDRLYRIFYPLRGTDPKILFDPASNPWRFSCADVSAGK